MPERLRPLWDFDDLDASEIRFRGRLGEESDDRGRAEVLTQLARVEGLRGDFRAGDELLDEAERLAGDDQALSALIGLERGRLRRSSGDPEAAYPLFTAAFETAREQGDWFLTGDAAHMAALAAPDDAGYLDWTERGIETAESSPNRYWIGPLLNNLGWHHYERGDHAAALEAFEGALRARERTPEREAEIELARYAVAKALRALGRPEEAAAALERAIAWTERAGRPDGWFHEELAEAYAVLGDDRAAEHARLALPLLEQADPSLDGDRTARLQALATGQGDLSRPRRHS